MKKYLIWFILVVIILTGVCILIGVNKTKTAPAESLFDTKKWVTYSNIEYSFGVKYPRLGSKQNVRVSDGPYPTIYFEEWSDEARQYLGMFIVRISTTTPETTLSTWVEENVDYGTGILMANKNFKFSERNGIEVAEFVGSLPSEFEYPVMLNYVIKKRSNPFVYTLYIDGIDNDLDLYGITQEHRAEFAEQILSTFEVI